MNDSNLLPPDKQLSKIEKQIKWSIFIALVLIALVLVMYFIHFNGDFQKDPDKWGTFGDFVGGTLNPVLAALAFYWLTSSIRLQIQELRDTRIVLQESAEHQKIIAELDEKNVNTQQEILKLQKSSLEMQIEASQQQQQQIAIQNFENIFFELLKTKNEAIQGIYFKTRRGSYSTGNIEVETVYGKEAINLHLKYFSEHVSGSWKKYYESMLISTFSSYFRVCYQIVRLIDSNTTLREIDKIENKPFSNKQKQYFDIFKATLQQAELEALFYNCLNGYSKYKRILEKYGIFEPLFILRYDNYSKLINQFAYMYDRSAFDRNKFFLKYFDDLEKINCNLNSKDINLNIIFLNKMGLVNKNIRNDLYDDEVLGDDYEDFYAKFIKKKSEYEKQILNEKNLSESVDNEYIERYIQILDSIEDLETIYYIVKYNINYEEYVKSRLTTTY
ncbi:putative phage abortive infection protein [Acinetobacter pittii]|uniref:putative phage abortive infection protein n=1 Tax=Acinetobacter pittii TaxID=48296 RepID=UPI000CE39D0D|nr:putative phage abortive infection protein [Acinetobacter pittii]PPC01560.1 hypothetical protein ApiMCR8900_18705 [Acinetobacter pittii]WPP59588.1 putative phage abortive infection protein [Acinetobacter pittii]